MDGEFRQLSSIQRNAYYDKIADFLTAIQEISGFEEAREELSDLLYEYENTHSAIDTELLEILNKYLK